MPLRIVFISCAPKQQPVARAVARDLAVARHRVFVDTQLAGDDHWWNTHLEQIRACDVFMPVLGRDFVDSETCVREATYAIALGKHVLPLRAEPVPTTTIFAPELSQAPSVDYRFDGRDAAIRLVSAVNAQPHAPPLPDPLPVPPPIPSFVIDRLRSRIGSLVALGQNEQVELLVRIRDLGNGHAHAVNELLTGLRDRPDILRPTRFEIDRMLAERPGE